MVRDQSTRQWFDWPLWLARGVLFGWWGIIFTLTHLPSSDTVQPPPIPDKLAHFIAYLVLGMLLPMWLGWHALVTLKRAAICFAIIVGYAMADELLQKLVEGRTAEWADGLADLCGGIVGIGIAATVRKRIHRMNERVSAAEAVD